MSQEENQPKRRFYPVPLHETQIDSAYGIIKENHPLNPTPIYIAFPWLKPFFCKSGKTDERQERLIEDEHRDKKKRKAPKKTAKEEDEEEEPFDLLGFGMLAYKNLLFSLIWLFVGLTFIMLPALIYYNKYDTYNTYPNVYSYFSSSLGNMGQAYSECSQVSIGSANSTTNIFSVPVTCVVGEYAGFFSYGVNPGGLLPNSYCSVQKDLNDNCTGSLNSKYINDTINSTVTIAQNQSSLNSFYINLDLDEMYQNSITNPSFNNCTFTNATFFIQYKCFKSQDMLKDQWSQLSWVSACSVFTACIFSIFVYYMKRISRMVYLNWDMSTITVGDYSVEYQISKEAYDHFLSSHYNNGDKQRGLSPGESFKEYMRKELESILTNELKEKKAMGGNEHIKINEVKIADIVFAFNNAQLIALLKERGGYITNQKYDQMRATEKKITELKDSDYENLTRPVCAFITFEEEDGYIIAQDFEPQHNWLGAVLPSKCRFLNQPLYLTEATEPTNIIWENRHITKRDRMKRYAISSLITLILLIISFVGIALCKSYSLTVSDKYDAGNCTTIQDAYGESLTHYAFEEYNNMNNYSDYTLTGTLQCFCDQQDNFISGYTTDDSVYNDTQTNQTDSICETYTSDLITANVLSNAVSYLIVGANFILRLFMIKLIQYIGYDTETEQTRLVTKGVFIVQYFNTGILLLLCNANFNQQGPILSLFPQGSLPDYTMEWYNQIGYSMVYAILFNIFWPLIEFSMYYAMRLFARLSDKNFKCGSKSTKKTTLQQYIEVYSGPSFFIHYKYSFILNIIFTTFTYGVGLPLLFPLAACAFIVLFIVEKSMIYYSYRMPPMYDDKLNKSVLSMMTWAPIYFLAMGYWMLSNKQLLTNEYVYEMEMSDSVPYVNHRWTDVITSGGYAMGPGLPLLLCFWVFFIIICFRDLIFKHLAKNFTFFQVAQFEIDEDLPNYFVTLDDHDRNWSIKEEENSRNVLGMNILMNDTLQKFKSTQQETKEAMQGVHTYDILANILYIDDFQYFSADLPNRMDYIIDDDEDESNDAAQSDLVRVILNLGFLSEEEAKNFTFDKSTYAKQSSKKGTSINKI